MRCIGFAKTQALVYGLPVTRVWIPSSHRVKFAALWLDILRNTLIRLLSSCLRQERLRSLVIFGDDVCPTNSAHVPKSTSSSFRQSSDARRETPLSGADHLDSSRDRTYSIHRRLWITAVRCAGRAERVSPACAAT